MSASASRPEETALFLADRCAELEAKNAKLLEAMRWRKWPEEKPVTSGRYLVLTDGSTDIGNHLSYWSRTAESWSTKDAGIAYWRPIGPLPGGE
jgi:hypothetical protein